MSRAKRYLAQTGATLLFVCMLFLIPGNKVHAVSGGEIKQKDQTKDSITIAIEAPSYKLIDDYQLYLYPQGKKYTSVDPIAVPNTTTSYTFDNLDCNTVYSATVEYTFENPFHEAEKRNFHIDALRTVPEIPTGLTNTDWNSTANQYILEWDEQKASGFELQIRNNKKKTISICTAASSTKHVFAPSRRGIYSVRIRAFNYRNGSDRVYGDWTKYLSVIPGIKTLDVSIKKGEMKLKWNKNLGITTYRIYLSTDNGTSYKLVKQVKGSKTSVKIKKIGSKKIKWPAKYRIKIVAVKKIGNQTIKSAKGVWKLEHQKRKLQSPILFYRIR